MKARSIALSLALLTSSALAQGSPLTFMTSEKGIAGWILDGFESQQEPPPLEDGMHYELALDDGGKIAVRTQQGKAARFECIARPGELMEMFESELHTKRAMLQGMFAMALGQWGIKASEAVKTFRTVMTFPAQVAEARLVVEGDSKQHKDGGGDISIREILASATLSLEPAAGTWFESFVSGLEVRPIGAPALDDDVHMALLLSAGFANPEVLSPFTDFFATVFAGAGSSHAQRVEMVNDLWAASDGTMAMAWDFGREGFYLLQGLSDPSRMQRVYDNDDFQAWIEEQYEIFFRLDPSIEDIEFVANGFEYRGIKLHKIVQQGDNGESFGVDGIAKDYGVSSMGMREADVKALLDRVLDGQIQRAPLAVGVLAELRLSHLSEWDLSSGGGRGQPDMDRAPNSIKVAMAKSAGSLVFSTKFEW